MAAGIRSSNRLARRWIVNLCGWGTKFAHQNRWQKNPSLAHFSSPQGSSLLTTFEHYLNVNGCKHHIYRPQAAAYCAIFNSHTNKNSLQSNVSVELLHSCNAQVWTTCRKTNQSETHQYAKLLTFLFPFVGLTDTISSFWVIPHPALLLRFGMIHDSQLFWVPPSRGCWVQK